MRLFKLISIITLVFMTAIGYSCKKYSRYDNKEVVKNTFNGTVFEVSATENIYPHFSSSVAESGVFPLHGKIKMYSRILELI